ncbi:MAG: hypothetical protein WA003_15590 [Desulfuromonadaceae bacterium]
MSEQDEKELLVARAKELGLKSPHLMGVDTLKERIAEAEKGGNAQQGEGSHGDSACSNPDCFEAQCVAARGAAALVELERLAAEEKLAEADKLKAEQEEKDRLAAMDTIAEADGWLYHETEEPRTFKAGEKCTGWSSENRKFWSFDDYGKWVRNGNA